MKFIKGHVLIFNLIFQMFLCFKLNFFYFIIYLKHLPSFITQHKIHLIIYMEILFFLIYFIIFNKLFHLQVHLILYFLTIYLAKTINNILYFVFQEFIYLYTHPYIN